MMIYVHDVTPVRPADAPPLCLAKASTAAAALDRAVQEADGERAA